MRHLRVVPPLPPHGELPRTRGECVGGSRPCPLVSCKHNLCVDVGKAGAVKVHWLPEDEPERPNCALDVADTGGVGQLEAAAILGVTRQRINQTENQAFRKMGRPLKRLGLREP